MNRLIFIVVVLATALSVGLVLRVGNAATQENSQRAGEDKTDAKKASKSVEKTQKTKGREISITPEREAAALTFVQQHHPELTRLLERLKTKSPAEYNRAVRDLFQVSERLAKIHERDSQRYEIELQVWQTKSRCELLAAYLQVKESPKLRDQLRQALADKEDAQIRLLELERDRLAERLKTVQANIEARNAAKQETVEQRLKQVAKSALERKKKREKVNTSAEKERLPTKP